jgi:hypothetical protein
MSNKCNKVRLYTPLKHSCGECNIDLANSDDMANIDLVSIMTIIFMISTNSNVCSHLIKIRNNNVMCDAEMEIEIINSETKDSDSIMYNYQKETAEESIIFDNMEYCVSILSNWMTFVQQKHPDIVQADAMEYYELLIYTSNIQEFRTVLLSAFV